MVFRNAGIPPRATWCRNADVIAYIFFGHTCYFFLPGRVDVARGQE